MELLAPAGNFEKLQIVIKYGANAVYLSGTEFSLRSGSDNFNLVQLEQAALYCQERGVKLYLTLNAFPLAKDLVALPKFLTYLAKLPINAVICADLAIIELVKEYSSFDIHVSTQASLLNWQQALVYKEIGAKRLILARETSLLDASLIRQKADIEVELFCHGAMCSALSGHCVLSNYQNGRDSNRGGCIQNCRHKYKIIDQENEEQSFYLGSKDLNAIDLLPKFIESNIDSIKIEGRMKSPLYAAVVIKAYRTRLDELINKGDQDNNDLEVNGLHKLNHRGYTTGFLTNQADLTSMSQGTNQTRNLYAGVILGEDEQTNEILFLVANKIIINDRLEFIIPSAKNKILRLEKIISLENKSMTKVNSGRIIKIPHFTGASANTLAMIISPQADSDKINAALNCNTSSDINKSTSPL
ncbi:MAG: U32 family peptidase [SAR324 cluster bacterium]|nr:U32 family peptidase [SAR324 cluster bacterium]